MWKIFLQAVANADALEMASLNEALDSVNLSKKLAHFEEAKESRERRRLRSAMLLNTRKLK